MRKRAKLTQEQLKAVLQGWKTTLLACCVWNIGEHLSDEHVYTQIEELIESGDTITVTRKWVESWATSLFDNEDEDEEMICLKISVFLKELGVEIVEPETIH